MNLKILIEVCNNIFCLNFREQNDMILKEMFPKERGMVWVTLI